MGWGIVNPTVKIEITWIVRYFQKHHILWSRDPAFNPLLPQGFLELASHSSFCDIGGKGLVVQYWQIAAVVAKNVCFKFNGKKNSMRERKKEEKPPI